MSWLEGWQYRKSHVIEGSPAGAVADYQVRIIAHYGSGSDSEEHVYLNEHARADFGDVRFTASDGETMLDYWIEELAEGDYAVFWVEVPSIPASPDGTTIYIYYGKDDAVSISSGDSTFIMFFDAEEASELDEWSTWGTTEKCPRSTEQARSGSYSYKGYYSGGTQYVSYKEITEATDRRIVIFFYDTGSPTSNYRGCITSADDQDTSCIIGLFYSSGLGSPNYVYRIGSTWYDTGISRSVGWHKFEYRFKAGNVKGYIDGQEIFSASEPDTVNRIIIGANWGWTAVTAYFDDIFIAKYIDPEPSHGEWGAEESVTPPPPPEVKPLYYIEYGLFEQIISMVYALIVLVAVMMTLASVRKFK